MTKDEAIYEINETQDYYVHELIQKIKENENLKYSASMKEINFTSPTGTGKTIMIAKLLNLMPNYFFFVTTLSRGQLKHQIKNSIERNARYENYVVHGLNDFTANTIMQSSDFLNELPTNKKIIWIRDEGHIATNRWQEILAKKSSVIINFSATNKDAYGIQCNFSHTMLLRTVSQNAGTPEDALNKLVEVKNNHRNIKNYNPCALFRCMDQEITRSVIELCKRYNFKCINITEEDYDMSELCEDSSSYDVIINKFRITEGIDLKRCHVIYMDNKPSSEATIIQVIGRARRNALLWRDDIDIFSSKYKKLLKDTRQCYIYYNIPETQVLQGENGELSYSLCDTISVEKLKPNTRIYVEKGQLLNGLYVLELANKTGYYDIYYNDKYKCNFVDNDDFYREEKLDYNPFIIDLTDKKFNIKKIYLKPNIKEFFIDESEIHEDLFKKNYLYYERYLDNKNIHYNKDKYRKIMGIGDVNHKASYEEFKIVITMIKDFIHGEDHLYGPGFEKALDYKGKKLATYKNNIYKKKIVAKEIMEKGWFSSNFDRNFVKYVEKVECVDFSVRDAIDKVIYNNFVIEDNGQYLCSNHPFTSHLRSSYGISNFKQLKKKVDSCKNKFCNLSKLEWQNIISSINSLEELDIYKVEKLDLFGLNKKYDMKLADEDINDYLNGVYKYKLDNNIKGITLMEYNSISKSYEYTNREKIVIKNSQFENKYFPYFKIVNDKEIALLGPDNMRFTKNGVVEDSAVSNKVNTYSKLRRYIDLKYEKELLLVQNQLYNGKNDFNINTKCNSCLGYCVEYYAKYLLYGDKFFAEYIDEARQEYNTSNITNEIIVRACMIMYRKQMVMAFGQGVSTIIPSISIEQLVQKEYKSFLELVIKLGARTADFIDSRMHIKDNIAKHGLINDPNLSVNHITGLCDFVNEDTLIDLKCTSNIKMEYIYQALAYHFLTTKRSDLNIKNIYVYDAVSDKFAYINIDK